MSRASTAVVVVLLASATALTPRQPVVWCENLSKSHDGLKFQLDDASLTLREGERCCVVGHNGCGKSSLLRIISGEDDPDGGGVRVRKASRVTAVEQEPLMDAADGALNVRDVLLAGDSPGATAARAYASATAAFEAAPGDAAAAAAFERAASAMTESDGWAAEAALATAAAKLNVEHLYGRRVSALSGGERKRVALAGALLSGGDVLVLDEPTNHLDLWAVRWLEGLLASEKFASKTVLFVSHDRRFSENVATSLVELDEGSIFSHDPGASGDLVEAYLVGKAKRLADARSAASSARSKLRDELAWLRRGAKARQTKSVERIAKVGALQDAARQVDDRGALALATGEDARRSARKKRTIATWEGVGVGDLFGDFEFELAHDARLGVVGANGSGKSTLVRTLVGAAARDEKLVGASAEEAAAYAEVFPDEGDVTLGNVRVAYYAQTPPDTSSRTPIDYALDVITRRPGAAVAAGDLEASAMALLKSYQFEDARAWRSPVKDLSGGERRRLSMMAALDANPDLLILDEPSNDLDLGALQALERFLADAFKGCLLLVSHDRSLLDATCRDLLVLPGDGYVSSFSGSMSEYLDLLDDDEAYEDDEGAYGDAAASAGAADGKAARKDADDARRRRHNAPREIAKLEVAIEAKEAAVAALDEALGAAASDATAAADLFVEREAAQREADALYARWEELEALLTEPA